ncbi:hypothetical protein U8335_07105 [Roseiconus lacunae]|uniref:hypothetical protein n=1 Tax=Roseiconus lacunae TaxID=2605694 RepID=UPI003085CF6A|nr:hypothetical protein U8335_07105 [Stieleria sp. HD01]
MPKPKSLPTIQSCRLFSVLSYGIVLAGVLLGSTARGDLVTSATLSINFDGDAFAAAADEVALQNVGVALTPGQSFMEFGLHADASMPGRPAPSSIVTDFRDLRNLWVRPSTSNLDYSFDSAALNPLSFDPSTIASSGAKGAATFSGGDSFWYANDAVIATGSSWLQFGNYELHYDGSRVDADNSGWLLTNTFLQTLPLFDIRNLSIGSVPADTSLAGNLLLSGDLHITDEFSTSWYMESGLNVGSFSFAGVTAVPEPSGVSALLVIAAGRVLIRRRRRRPLTVK